MIDSNNIQIRNPGDLIFTRFLRIVGFSFVAIFIMLILNLILSSKAGIQSFGLGFLGETIWDPVEDIYGSLPFAYGTVLTSLLAVFISVPPCIALALFTTELCPPKLRNVISFLIEMLAAIPSIVYGLWALFVLAPFIRTTVFPFINEIFPNISFLQGPSFGIGILASALILAIMISPIITAVTIEVFKAIPPVQRYAALALGATRFEMMQIALLKPGAKGILGGVILGLGRALGETMAVAMVIGNSPEIAKSIFHPGSTMAAVIANEYAEAAGDLHLSSLNYIALVLFVITFLVNFLAKGIIREKNYD